MVKVNKFITQPCFINFIFTDFPYSGLLVIFLMAPNLFSPCLCLPA